MRRIIILKKDSIDPDNERMYLEKHLHKFRDNVEHLILRIDKKHIEVDVEAEQNILSNISRYLGEIGYTLVEEVDIDENQEEEGEWIKKFLNLYSQGRYWEIHEMLEKIWRRDGSCFFRALILFVIPYIKVQMGQYREAIKAYNRFLEYSCMEEERYGIDLKCLKDEVKKLVSVENPDLYSPISIERCIKNYD